MASATPAALRSVKPPGSVRGMKKLDKEALSITAQVPGFRVPAKSMHQVLSKWKKQQLRVPKVKPVAELSADDPDVKTHKLLLLDPDARVSRESLAEEDRQFLQNAGVDLTSFQNYEINLGYDNWKYDEILDAILPEESDGIGGFSQIGTIVHLNLRADLLDYKHIIGEVLLDKVPTARTVVNKLGTIANVYRTFDMELLAGEDNTLVTTSEMNCSYTFDFAKVYWNPKLGSEHGRVVEDLERGDVVYDVFAGVGPFAVPAVKKGAIVLANDLNPESYKWLNHNLKHNKTRSAVKTFNLDGRKFITDVVKKDVVQRWQGTHEDQKRHDNPDLNRIRFYMNLPDSAVEFLDVFPGLFQGVNPDELPFFKPPLVYCYCFSKSDDLKKDAKERVEARVGCKLDEEETVVRIVRNVAPNKEMLCVIFPLQKNTLFEIKLEEAVAAAGEEPPGKKVKLL